MKVIGRLEKLRIFRFLLNSNTLVALIGKSILMILIPYAYLFFCGFVFDALLKWYFMTTFIFVTLVLLYIFAFLLIIKAISKFRRQRHA